jgi:phosphoribosylanthranilate isomerase
VKFSHDRFFVKICGITTEEDALMCVGLGASALGFVFAASPRQMTVQAVADIVRRLPPDIITVGVFRNERPETVAEAVNHIGLSAAQLHGGESSEALKFVAERVHTVIRAIPVSSPRLRYYDDEGADYLLLDGDRPGSGESHGWEPLTNGQLRTPCIAAGGLTPANVAHVVATLPVMGVDVLRESNTHRA